MKKPISKTPRTDRQHILNFGPNLYVKIGFARQLERQLNVANQRIKRLEDIIEKASKHFRIAGPNAFTAYEMADVLKEAKP